MPGLYHVKSLHIMRSIQTFKVIRREGATPTNSNRRRLFVQELRPRDEGRQIPARPAWAFSIQAVDSTPATALPASAKSGPQGGLRCRAGSSPDEATCSHPAR